MESSQRKERQEKRITINLAGLNASVSSKRKRQEGDSHHFGPRVGKFRREEVGEKDSSEDIGDEMGFFDTDQFVVQALKAETESFVVDAEEMQVGRVQIPH